MALTCPLSMLSHPYTRHAGQRTSVYSTSTWCHDSFEQMWFAPEHAPSRSVVITSAPSKANIINALLISDWFAEKPCSYCLSLWLAGFASAPPPRPVSRQALSAPKVSSHSVNTALAGVHEGVRHRLKAHTSTRLKSARHVRIRFDCLSCISEPLKRFLWPFLLLVFTFQRRVSISDLFNIIN